ncbi:cytochrome c biogenesis CcdA family protein [Microbacterium sp.]|uniref:cytochrome c biogenesis CcdA family protein n=1 Tax=Microbacterium sp. TaxID=51671 RepID=UPI0025E908D4|nr:cytochrome c biogenesis CcdA family protein [Microbacterium sp.]MBT9605033.1 cytochrome c biogenesis protein CcdA [Microbacterium sp.]
MSAGALVIDGALWLAIPLALLAGAISFASPCVLPLVPGYLGYLGGVTSPPASPSGTAGATASRSRARLMVGVLLFIGGFTAVFVTVTVLGGMFGVALLRYADLLTRVFGIVNILLGLIFVGAVRFGQRSIRPALRGRAGLIGAPLLGFSLGVGWTPCIGPTLAAILSVSWNLGDPARAGLLGLSYSLGLGVPFVVLALGWGWAARSVSVLRIHIRALNLLGGGLLILLGLLMVTGVWTSLMSLLQQVVVNVPLPL